MIYKVSTPRKDEKSGKTYWTELGVAFSGAKGIQVKLHGLPVSGEMWLFPREENEQRRGKDDRGDDVPY